MSELTPKEPIVNLELALDHSLTHKEYEMIVDRLGRTPSFTELGVYSVTKVNIVLYKESPLLSLKNSPEKANIYWSKPVKRMPGWLILAMVWVVRLKLKVIIILLPWNHIKELQPELEGFIGIFSRWCPSHCCFEFTVFWFFGYP